MQHEGTVYQPKSMKAGATLALWLDGDHGSRAVRCRFDNVRGSSTSLTIGSSWISLNENDFRERPKLPHIRLDPVLQPHFLV